MSTFTLQTMQRDDWDEVATLIHDSTNAWYEANRNFSIFPNGPESTRLFCEVYESLDPGCCLIAKSVASNQIIGSCFYHPRETHFSLGIMNVHPDHFGKGIARTLLQRIIDLAEAEQKPVRLVSSAMNLDSFSLYTLAGFVPRCTFQDMIIEIPAGGIAEDDLSTGAIRDATVDDVPSMMQLEQEVAGIHREKDYRHFVDNREGYWHTSVLYEENRLAGWIASIAHSASRMVGPGIARDQNTAIRLLRHELNERAGETMVFLVPVECDRIVQAAYGWGARNCELHVAQVYGTFTRFEGVVMPTFMPETG